MGNQKEEQEKGKENERQEMAVLGTVRTGKEVS